MYESLAASILMATSLFFFCPSFSKSSHDDSLHDSLHGDRILLQGSAFPMTAGWPSPACAAAWSRSAHRWWTWTTWVTGTMTSRCRLCPPAAWRSNPHWLGSSSWCHAPGRQKGPHAPLSHCLRYRVGKDMDYDMMMEELKYTKQTLY